jgi:hypothetical protein
MIGHKARRAREGVTTQRCGAVTADGPCKKWTEFEFCHVHEWKVNKAVLSTRQSFVLLFPKAVARLARLIEEPDGETALKAIMVTLKYIVGDKTLAEGMPAAPNPLADLTTEQLVARAQVAIAALQQPPTAALETGQDAPAAPFAAPCAGQPGPHAVPLDGQQTPVEGAA